MSDQSTSSSLNPSAAPFQVPTARQPNPSTPARAPQVPNEHTPPFYMPPAHFPSHTPHTPYPPRHSQPPYYPQHVNRGYTQAPHYTPVGYNSHQHSHPSYHSNNTHNTYMPHHSPSPQPVQQVHHHGPTNSGLTASASSFVPQQAVSATPVAEVAPAPSPMPTSASVVISSPPKLPSQPVSPSPSPPPSSTSSVEKQEVVHAHVLASVPVTPPSPTASAQTSTSNITGHAPCEAPSAPTNSVAQTVAVDVDAKDVEPDTASVSSAAEDEPVERFIPRQVYSWAELKQMIEDLDNITDGSILYLKTKTTTVVSDFLKSHIAPAFEESEPRLSSASYSARSNRPAAKLTRAGSLARTRSYESRSQAQPSKFLTAGTDAYKMKRDVEGDERKLRNVKTILNKISENNVEKLASDIRELDIDSMELFKEVVDLVFEKAVTESHLSHIYARLCHILHDLVVPLSDQASAPGGKEKTFKRMILTISHENLQGNDFSRTLSLEEFNLLDEAEQLEITLSRRRYLGAIKFMCELYQFKLLGGKHIFECMNHLLQFDGNDDAMEALCHLLLTIGNLLTTHEATSGTNHVITAVDQLRVRSKDREAYSARIRYMMMDVCERYDNVWSKVSAEAARPDKLDRRGDRYDRGITRESSTHESKSDRKHGGVKQVAAKPSRNIGSRSSKSDWIDSSNSQKSRGSSNSNVIKRTNSSKPAAKASTSIGASNKNTFGAFNLDDDDDDENEDDHDEDDENEDEDDQLERDLSLDRIPTDYPNDELDYDEDDIAEFDDETMQLLEKYLLNISSTAGEYAETRDLEDIKYSTRHLTTDDHCNLFARQMFFVLQDRKQSFTNVVALIPHLPLTPSHWRKGYEYVVPHIPDVACDSPDFPGRIGQLLAYLVQNKHLTEGDINWDQLKENTDRYYQRIETAYQQATQ